MPNVTLYTPDENDEMLEEAEALLETAYLDYNTKASDDVISPKLEIERDNGLEVYRGPKEIREGLEETDLEDLDRKF